MRDGQDIVAAARACVGSRFRVHGRDPAWGLDCVGVAARAFGIAAPADYPTRGGTADQIARLIDAAGLRARAAGEAGPGDLLLANPGPGQWHLVVLTERGFIHADAGLRRVVETPGRLPWPALGAWTRGED